MSDNRIARAAALAAFAGEGTFGIYERRRKAWQRAAHARLLPFMETQCPDGTSCVYVLRELEGDRATEYAKIGASNRLSRRMSELQIGNPRELTVELSIPFATLDEAQRVETFIHSMLSEHRVGGEWFAVTSAELLVELDKLMDAATAPPAPAEAPAPAIVESDDAEPAAEDA